MGLGGMTTWLRGLFAFLAGQPEKRQRHGREAGKREGRQTKGKHKAKGKTKELPFLKRAEPSLTKHWHAPAPPHSPRGWYSLHFVTCLSSLTSFYIFEERGIINNCYIL